MMPRASRAQSVYASTLRCLSVEVRSIAAVPDGSRLQPEVALLACREMRRLPGLGLLLVIACGPDVDGERPVLAEEASSEPRSHADDGGPRTITLITGDRVTVYGAGTATVTPGPGRSQVHFVQERHGTRLRVLPADAIPFVRAGKLDPRLFDVTLLLEQHHDRRADVPLIVTRPRASGVALVGSELSRVLSRGGRVTRELPRLGATALRASADGALWRSLTADPSLAYTRIWLDGMRRPTLDVSVPLIGAPAAWTSGFDGTGVTIAVLDSGIDTAHPDLAGRVIGGFNFTADDPVFGEDALDHEGHGTHVASTIAGSGAASNGAFRGVAPGAQLLDVKVCTWVGCEESWLLAGMDWAAQRGARVINMSLGGPDFPELDPLEAAVDTLTAEYGVLFVIAAGNEYGDRTIGSPGSADAALTVAAFDKRDRLADFSSRGPRVGDHALKPDVSGPGVGIVAARSKDGKVGAAGELYTALSGTSMATPHVAGAAAILAQRQPTWTPAQLKAALMAAATPTPDLTGFQQGAGRVDIARALGQLVTTEPTALSFGQQRFPHDDDAPETRTLTYHNPGAAALTLELSVHASGGVFSLGAASVAVPAGGSAAVEVTCDTRAGEVLGLLGGYVTASSSDGSVHVQTPIGVDREAESYDIRLVTTNRDGEPAESFETVMFSTDVFELLGGYYAEEPTSTLRAPRGHYNVMSTIEDGGTSTLLYHPTFELDSDRTIALDARLGKPIQIQLPHGADDVELVGGSVELMDFPTPGGGTGMELEVASFDELFLAQLGASRSEHVEGNLGGTWARRNADGTFDDSHEVYTLVWFFQHALPDGFSTRVRARDLAVVDAEYASQAPGTRGTLGISARSPLSAFAGGNAWSASPLEFALPFRRTEYFNLDSDVSFSNRFDERDGANGQVGNQNGPSYRLERGRSKKRANRGVFAPNVVSIGWNGTELGAYGTVFGGLSEGSYVTRVIRNGVVVGESTDGTSRAAAGSFEVPPGPARYRVELEGVRTIPGAVSTTVEAAYEFDASGVDGPLPVSYIDFSPRLDRTNSARAGEGLEVPISVTPRANSTAGAPGRPRVEVSYDDGRTWHRTRVHGREAADWHLELRHPRHAREVALRASSTDEHGNRSEVTILRAYHLR
jgi:subtilisin family serine protease